jgi:hypothetical protein
MDSEDTIHDVAVRGTSMVTTGTGHKLNPQPNESRLPHSSGSIQPCVSPTRVLRTWTEVPIPFPAPTLWTTRKSNMKTRFHHVSTFSPLNSVGCGKKPCSWAYTTILVKARVVVSDHMAGRDWSSRDITNNDALGYLWSTSPVLLDQEVLFDRDQRDRG